MAKKQHQELMVYADYYQFYFCEQSSRCDTAVIWDQPGSAAHMLAHEPDFLAVGTKRYAEVPVVIELYDKAPRQRKKGVERMNECELSIKTVAVIGNYISLGELIPLPFIAAGQYHVRILYERLSTVVDDWNGQDKYCIQLWQKNM